MSCIVTKIVKIRLSNHSNVGFPIWVSRVNIVFMCDGFSLYVKCCVSLHLNLNGSYSGFLMAA
jgi:hypothetical protein